LSTCGMKFLTKNCLRIHRMETHKMGVKLKGVAGTKCKLCYKILKSENGLAVHVSLQHRNDKKYLKIELTEDLLKVKCENCDLMFLNKDILSYHMSDRHSDKECKLCYKHFKCASNVPKHMTKCHKEDKEFFNRAIEDSELRFPCQLCPKKFVKESILATHKRKAHAIKTENECKLCYKYLKQSINMPKHMENYHKDDTEFLNRTIKDSELTFSCDECPRKFVKNSLMTLHKKRGHGTKAVLECKLCYKKLGRAVEVQKHMKNVHKDDQEFLGREIEDSELVHTCTTCNKGFVKESILQKHEVSHKVLQYEFLRKQCIIKQGKTRGYKCKLCYVRIGTFVELIEHILTSHESDKKIIKMKISEEDCKFACDQCNLKFFSKDVLEYHIDCKHRRNKVCAPKPNKPSKEDVSKCILCHVEFESRKQIQNHVHNIHRKHKVEMEVIRNPGSKSHFKIKCRFCPENFMNLHVLGFHVSRRHKEEKKSQAWVCDFCSHNIKPSKNISTMIKNHMRRVHGEEGANSQIARPEESDSVKNFRAMMEMMAGRK